MSPATKIFSLVAVVFLTMLALGIDTVGLQTARLIVFISAIYLIVSSFRTKERLWMALFIAIAIIFNPAKEILKLSRTQWRVLDLLIVAGFAIFFYRYYDGYKKGSKFEKFVSSLLPENEWVIEDWTKDKSKRLRRQVESDKNPDLTVRNKRTGERIAVECKFRSRPWTNKFGINGISWNAYNHDCYRRYGEKERIPVRVIFGLGGNPKSPEKIFVVPLEGLEQFKGKNIPLGYLGKFEKNIKTQPIL
ncbi:MAG TPA: DUF6804 family protein [Candidatus Paceibacterota bacterium]|nr:DUF6804 family protein [Candidatus Paceibacterota bacterium]